MKGIVKKDEEGNFIVVYHKECVEDSDAVIRVSCKIISDYRTFKEGDYIEFELVDIVTDDDGSFASFAIPTLKINPHISHIVNKNNEINKKGMTLREKFAEVELERGITSKLEKIADGFAIEFAEWIAINDYRFYSNGWSKVFKKGNITSKEILEIYKKEKGL